jgi:hypothetical protein
MLRLDLSPLKAGPASSNLFNYVHVSNLDQGLRASLTVWSGTMTRAKVTQSPGNRGKGEAPKGEVPVRISLTVDQRTAMKLDKEISEVRSRHPDVNPTRSSVARAILMRGLVRRASTKEERSEARASIKREAGILKLQAMNQSVMGDGEHARHLHLLAAARELEALAVMRSPDDQTVLSTLIEVVGEVKAATGYRSLPDVPRKR